MARGGRRSDEDFHVTCSWLSERAPIRELSDGSAQAENRVEDRCYASASRQRETVTAAMCDGFAMVQSIWESGATRSDVAATLGTGAEKSPTDRVQKARDRLVALMNHTEPAGERIDAYGLPIGRKISQHSRPPDRLERQRPIICRKRQDAEIRDDCSTLWLGSKELLYLLPAGGRWKLGRYPLQHRGHRRGRSRRPQAIHNFASIAPEGLLARRWDRDDAGADKDAAVAGFN